MRWAALHHEVDQQVRLRRAELKALRIAAVRFQHEPARLLEPLRFRARTIWAQKLDEPPNARVLQYRMLRRQPGAIDLRRLDTRRRIRKLSKPREELGTIYLLRHRSAN